MEYNMAKLGGTRLGAFRAYFFGFFVCTAGFLFGYVGATERNLKFITHEAKLTFYPRIPVLLVGEFTSIRSKPYIIPTIIFH